MAALLAIALILVVGYLISLKIHPETYCRRCGGSGRNRGSTKQRSGRCKRCGGTGRKPRLGNRMLGRGGGR